MRRLLADNNWLIITIAFLTACNYQKKYLRKKATFEHGDCAVQGLRSTVCKEINIILP